MKQQQQKDDRIAVRFTRKFSPYNAGELAGFAPHHAHALVVQFGVAEFLTAADAARAAAAPPVQRRPGRPGDGVQWA